MTRFYVIRHGETEPNTRFACLGRRDEPLNARGYAQADALCGRIAKTEADAVYISPLSRAYETIKPYCRLHPNIPIITDDNLTERDYGIWDNMTFAEIEREYKAEYDAWQSDFTGYRVPDGESSEDVDKRVRAAIDAILAAHSGGTVFIVTHLGTARQIISRLLGLTLAQSWRFTVDNAAFAVIDYDNNTGYGVLKYLNI